MKKFIIFGGITIYCIFFLASLVYSFVDQSTQIAIINFTRDLTLLTLLFVCLLAGFSYCQEHQWSVLGGFIACGLMALAYFMYIFLPLSPQNSTITSLLIDIASTLLAWSFALPLINDILKND